MPRSKTGFYPTRESRADEKAPHDRGAPPPLASEKKVRAHKEIPGGLLPLGSDPLSEHLIALINPGGHEATRKDILSIERKYHKNPTKMDTAC